MNQKENKSLCLTKYSPASRSYWIGGVDQPQYAHLDQDLSVDVAVIGGGIVGITAAWLLKQAGISVAVLEAGRILRGTTGHSTAKVTSQHGMIYEKIIDTMGEELAKQYAEANEHAIRFIAGLVEKKKIDCDFSWQPAYVYTQSAARARMLMRETNTASRLGIKASFTESLPLPFKIEGAMKFSDQAQFHPVKYLMALSAEIPDHRSHIFEQTRVIDLEAGTPNRLITANKKKITATDVIIASHYPFYDKPGLYFIRMHAERSYVLAAIIKEVLPEGMFISAEQPTRSLRTQPSDEGNLILIGGDSHKTGHGRSTLKHYEALCQFAATHFQVEELLFRWSAQDCMTLDGIPYIGHLTSDHPGVYVATGFGKWGMTNGTAAAIMLRDLIVKGDSPWLPVYNPSRIRPRAAATDFVVQTADVAAQFIAGKLFPNSRELNLLPGQGKVVKWKNQRAGAFCDDLGQMHLVDTTCTHMGCELAWNDAEKSWDCPCHGSRFSYTGRILEGPAVKPLKKIEE